MRPLTPKQERFCVEYLVDLNATQAAIRAGYKPQTANQQGSQNLAKLGISSRIEKLREAQTKRTLVTADYVVEKLKTIVEASGNPETEQYEPQAANAALGWLGKHLGMYVDRVDSTGTELVSVVVLHGPSDK